MHWAAAENHEEVVATLLDHNADVLLETRDGVTAGELAAIRKNEYVIYNQVFKLPHFV